MAFVGQRSFTTDKRWEEKRTREIIDGGFFKHSVVVVTDRETQKRGIDAFVLSPRGRQGIEFKIVRYESSVGAITIETHSVLANHPDDDIGDGWISYSEADWLIWAFEDKAYIWRMPDLRTWFYLQDVTQWPLFDIDNKNYVTRCRKVPLEDIPLRVWTREYK